jgi:serine/threonine-protein kinase
MAIDGNDAETRVGAVAPSGLVPGAVLFGEYEIVDVLGAGGMGEVYRARHRRLDEFRAIKVMHANIAADTAAAELFDREAKALLSVHHPAVVSCHDLLSDERGNVYLVMEMVDGVPLSELIEGGPLSPGAVRVLGRRLAEGLTAAHAQGVIHRDLSPDNVVLPEGDPVRAKLIDFGIAKVLESGQETILDGFKGKLSYASPEQLGFFGGAIDGRSDWYSLGLLLCAAAVGRPLELGRTFAEAVDARRQLTQLPPEVPTSLLPLIEPLIRLDPADRPEAALSLFVEGREQPEPENGGPNLRIAWLAGAGGAVLLVATVLALLIGGEPEQRELSDPLDQAAQPELTPTTVPSGEVPDPVPVEPLRAGATKPVEPAAAKPATKPAAAKPSRTATLRRELRIVGLLKGAEAAVEDDRLTSPAGDNAYEKYRAVLELSPAHAEALEGMRRLADVCVTRARETLGAGDLERAERYLGEAALARPDHPELPALRASLRERRAQ